MTDKYRIAAENSSTNIYQSGYSTLEEAKIGARKLAETERVNVVVSKVIYTYKIEIVEEWYD